MRLWNNWARRTLGISQGTPKRHSKPALQVENLESRELLSTTPLPVLLVIADQQDFYFREYNETRKALLHDGVGVVVAATTQNVSYPHPNSGQNEAGVSGAVTPNIALANANASDYSGIAFIGGWGSSMYQYAFNDPNFDGVTDNLYFNSAYNGDNNLNDGIIAPQKVVVNDLINEFLASDKPVAAICHGVTVLAWARVNGVSPLAGKQVSVPLTVGSPSQYSNGAERHYPSWSLQHEQVVANGGIANTVSGQYGTSPTALDDVVVDGRIITAENYDSAPEFGRILAKEILKGLPQENQAPSVQGASWAIPENATLGTLVGNVQATDPDSGQSLTYSLIHGNVGGAFALNPTTGALTVANPGSLDFEATPSFTLTVRVRDNGVPALDAFAQILVQVGDVYEPVSLTAGNLNVVGTALDDTIYVWCSGPGKVSAWMNGTSYGTYQLAAGGGVRIFGGEGNDRIAATDLCVAAEIYGQGGHDQVTGGYAGDLLDGGDGVDRLWGGPGDDILLGGPGGDFLYGREGNDVLVGGAGDDVLEGFEGRDILFGGLGTDTLRGQAGEDLLIGGTTSYDTNPGQLAGIRSQWAAAEALLLRIGQLSDPMNPLGLRWGATVFDDGIFDVLNGGAAGDWLFAMGADLVWALEAADRVS